MGFWFHSLNINHNELLGLIFKSAISSKRFALNAIFNNILDNFMCYGICLKSSNYDWIFVFYII